METFRWLHLSDLHRGLRSQGWMWPNLEDHFLADLSGLHDRCGPWHAVLFTGDLVQSGLPEEFDKLSETLGRLWAHLNKLGSNPQFLAVPGNHDLLRPSPILPTMRVLSRWADDPKVQEEFWHDPDSPYRALVNDAFAPYCDWLRSHPLPKPEDYSTGSLPGDFSSRIAADGLTVGVVGLNTTFLQLTSGDYEGRVWIHPVQLSAVCGETFVDWFQRCDVAFLLTHHPPQWLADPAREHLCSEIAVGDRFALHLCGHLHEPVLREEGLGAGPLRRVLQGCSLFGLESWGEGKARARNYGYSAGMLALSRSFLSVRLWPRRAERHQAGHRHLVPDHTFTLQPDEGTPPAETKSPSQGRHWTPSRPTVVGVPQFPGSVPRPALAAAVHNITATRPIAAIEGLSGTGKTYLAAQYLRGEEGADLYRTVYWYDAEPGDTLDDVLVNISVALPLPGKSAHSQSKHLTSLLRERRALLVLDDFHQVKTSTFAPLLQFVARLGSPATLLLLSRAFVEPLRTHASIGHLEIAGFTVTEATRFLATAQMEGLTAPLVEELVDKTDGLPLAISLFKMLVIHQKRDPNELLKGKKLLENRLRQWFDDVVCVLSNEEPALLGYLSLCGEPFNPGLAAALGYALGLSDPERAFDTLQRYYLVQRYTPYRCKVHQLIASLAQTRLAPSDRNRGHLAIAGHYVRGVNLRHRGVRSDDEFVWLAKACKHFQLAGQRDQSEAVLHGIAETAKARGLYDSFLRLAKSELDASADRDTWLDYHYAHCALIVGNVLEALGIVEPLILSTGEAQPSKRVQIVRLYAEILCELGQLDKAVGLLGETIGSAAELAVDKSVSAHARSVYVGLLTENGQLKAAGELAASLLAEAENRGDKRGAAVALTRLGIVALREGRGEDAVSRFEHAVKLFRAARDRRGEAWSLSHLAVCLARAGDRDEANEVAVQALEIKEDIGECSQQYLRLLGELAAEAFESPVRAKIDAEIMRTRARLDGGSS